jgi:O-antigen ligase
MVVILFLLPATVRNERDLKRLALVVLITLSVSAVFAWTQHFNRLGYLPLYEIYGDSVRGARVAGLSETPVQLGFNLPMVLLPLIALYFLKGVNSRIRKLFILLIIMIFGALFYTFTRTGIFSLAPGLLLMFFLMKGKPKKQLFLIALILGFAFFCYINITGSRYSQGFTESSSAAARPVLWQAGVNIALDNPILGIGSYNFREVSQGYASTINPVFMETQGGGKILGETTVHNDFIRVWASFGTVALLAYLLMFVGIFRNFLESYRKSLTPFLKAFSLGCFGALAAYIFNAATHNVMGSSMLLWISGGFSIATAKVVLSMQLSKTKGIR